MQAYDVRPAAKEQIQSVGGKAVEIGIEGSTAEGAGGYARAMDEEFYRRQRAGMAKFVAENDIVITTASVPGKKAPVLIKNDMLQNMAPGSIVVDLAAERGNCEGTRPGETVVLGPATILGPVNIPSTIPHHASQMFSRNVAAFLEHLRLATDFPSSMGTTRSFEKPSSRGMDRLSIRLSVIAWRRPIRDLKICNPPTR